MKCRLLAHHGGAYSFLCVCVCVCGGSLLFFLSISQFINVTPHPVHLCMLSVYSLLWKSHLSTRNLLVTLIQSNLQVCADFHLYLLMVQQKLLQLIYIFVFHVLCVCMEGCVHFLQLVAVRRGSYWHKAIHSILLHNLFCCASWFTTQYCIESC